MHSRSVLFGAVVESSLIGILGTLAGIGLGLGVLALVVDLVRTDVFPELGTVVSLSAPSVATATLVGALVVGLAPLLWGRDSCDARPSRRCSGSRSSGRTAKGGESRMAPQAATQIPASPSTPKAANPDGLWKRSIAGAGRGLQLLWRYRLGWLAGHAFLVVTHRGRRTGKERRTVLYVQRYDRRTREATVISVFGEAQWLRNIRATPALGIEIALQRYIPEQRFLTTDEIFEIERRFRRRHRVVAWGQAKLMHWPWPATDDQLRELSAELRGVTFRPDKRTSATRGGSNEKPRTAPRDPSPGNGCA